MWRGSRSTTPTETYSSLILRYIHHTDTHSVEWAVCTNTMCSSSLSLSLSLVGSVKCVTSTTCPGQRWVCPPRLWSSSTSSEKCKRTLPLSTQNPPSLYTAGQHTQYPALYAAGQHLPPSLPPSLSPSLPPYPSLATSASSSSPSSSPTAAMVLVAVVYS